MDVPSFLFFFGLAVTSALPISRERTENDETYRSIDPLSDPFHFTRSRPFPSRVDSDVFVPPATSLHDTRAAIA